MIRAKEAFKECKTFGPIVVSAVPEICKHRCDSAGWTDGKRQEQGGVGRGGVGWGGGALGSF